MSEIQSDNPVELVRNAIIALQAQKAALQRQSAEIDEQLSTIVDLASAPGTRTVSAMPAPMPAPVPPAVTSEGIGKTRQSATQYTPRSGTCAAVVMEVMSDGKERTRQEITGAVQAKLGAQFNGAALYPAMAKLISRQVLAPVKTRPGNWVLNR